MSAAEQPHIRPMIAADIPRLAEIRPGFVSASVLELEQQGSGLDHTWRLVERPLAVPFDKEHAYDFDLNEQRNIRQRFEQGTGLHLVVEWRGRLVGILDVIPQEWNNTAWIWNIMLDESVRRQGLGRALFQRAVAWARRCGYRALGLETQTNNVPACKFYLAMGMQLEGIRTAYYHNDDIARQEVAIFFTYPLV